MTQGSKTRIKVFVRCRPANTSEQVDNGVLLDTNNNKIHVKSKNFQNKDYDFDRVFGMEETQERVFKDVAEEAIEVLLHHLLTMFRTYLLAIMGLFSVTDKLELEKRIHYVVEHQDRRESYHEAWHRYLKA
jgi:hypothetical protein